MTRLQLVMARHCKAAIAGGPQEWQNVNDRSERVEVTVHQTSQTLETGSLLLCHRIRIGDQDSISP